MKYQNIREEELKNKVAQDFFDQFDCSNILGNLDFCVIPTQKDNEQEDISEVQTLLWAEAKKGDFDLYAMFAQLILTIGKERTFDKYLPPAFLGAFDGKKIAFVPYNHVMDIFIMNDFNWNVTPSNHTTKEFFLIKDRITKALDENNYLYDYLSDEAELKFFIKNNIGKASKNIKIHIDKNNFVPIYLRWLEQIKPYINFDWAAGKKQNILDSDFYLADLFVDDKGTTTIDDDTTVRENLFVIFKNSRYEISKENLKSLFNATIDIKDKNTYEQFWKKYKRPPVSLFHDYIIDRRDLLIPQDIRERKGAFFTPQLWVSLSQKYIADVLGIDWQDEYYVWDCAAGTGNLLAGLTNKYHIYASTLDQADVNVMQDRIQNGANLLNDHVFQFDFLNDDFAPISQGGKIPDNLFKIINNKEKRKKLLVYINPPYAEATSAKTVTGTGENKSGVATEFKINDYFKPKIGNASNEIFALFMANIYEKMNGCLLGQFSKLKFVNGSNFSKFKDFFKADFLKGFIVPAVSFDNVSGSFPIGFTFWNTNSIDKIEAIQTDVYNKKGSLDGVKMFYGNLPESINKWIKIFDDKSNIGMCFMGNPSPDFQHNSQLYVSIKKGIEHFNFFNYTQNNLIQGSIYFTVRQVFKATWINDRDQFLFPNNNWKKDKEFQNDCLTFMLFHGQNRISSKDGTNHWIPFTEQEVNAKTTFDSSFMTQFIKGKIEHENIINDNLFVVSEPTPHYEIPLQFSEKALKVFASGLELWKYYHTQPNINVNASLYDIREHFQGRSTAGKMNSKSKDETYNILIDNLRKSLTILSKKIEPMVYEYGFLTE